MKPHFVPDAGPRTYPPSSSGTVLFVGRLSAEKGIGMLLDAWSVSDTGDLTLRIIGDGPLRADVEQRKIGGVELAGWMSPDELAKELRSARALLVPSLSYEPFGLVLIEGMAAGMPVVASGCRWDTRGHRRRASGPSSRSGRRSRLVGDAVDVGQRRNRVGRGR